MGKIVAIGGGEIKKHETLAIDKEIIRLSGKKRPKVLFIPTASSDSLRYIENVVDYYGRHLGCTVDILKLIDQSIDIKEISKKILRSDIIYVGGGNTLKMMTLWRKLGVDVVLKKAYKKGIVLCGLSAGAICWFAYGNSDSRQYKNPDASLIKVRGLGLLNVLLCPHYHSKKYGKGRIVSLKKMMKHTSGIALAIDDFCALVIIDENYKIITSKKSCAYKVYWSRGKYYHENIEQTSGLKSIKNLLHKNNNRSKKESRE